jgi:hypothetical protein
LRIEERIMFRHVLIALAILALTLTVTAARAATTGATVGLDDDFWGTSIGQVDNSSQAAPPYGVFTGALDMATVNNWLTTGGVHSFALIPPQPDYYGNSSLPLAGVPDVGVQEMTLTLGDSSQVTVPLTNAAFIKRGIPYGPYRDFYYDDMNFHDHESPDCNPLNGGPRPVLYQVDLSACQGQSLATDPVLDLQGIGFSEEGRTFDVYEVTEPYDYTDVTYASLLFSGPPPFPPPPLELCASQDAYLVTGNDTPNGTEAEHCITTGVSHGGAIIYSFDPATADAEGLIAIEDGVLSVNVSWAPEEPQYLGVYELIGDDWDETTVTAVNFCYDGEIPNCLGDLAGTALIENVGDYMRQEIPVAEATITRLLNGEIHGLALSSAPGSTLEACVRTVNADWMLHAEPKLVFDAEAAPPVSIPGDTNRDSVVSDADYTIWADNYGAGDASWEMGDFNGDGMVSDADYTIWADHYGESEGSVPEPVTTGLMALGSLAFLCQRKGSRALASAERQSFHNNEERGTP